VEIGYMLLLDKDTEWNWTKEQRDEFIETKRKQIINILAKNCINPQTKKPHPPIRIEKAIKEAKYNISTSKSAEEQIKDVISAISAIIPIRMENVELAVKIPASFAPKAYGVVEKYGHVKQSEWQNDGSWVGTLELPAGFEAEFLENVNKLTHGRAEIKVLKRT
jgi:ribosome maturation protein SDO1